MNKKLSLALTALIIVIGFLVNLHSTLSHQTEVASSVETAATSTGQLYKVSQVVDGNTIKVDLNGTIETIRLIGINTPETVDPRKPVECFGKEASDKAKALLSNTNVSLEADPTQGERDKYGRLLRYVFMEDGTFSIKV